MSRQGNLASALMNEEFERIISHVASLDDNREWYSVCSALFEALRYRSTRQNQARTLEDLDLNSQLAASLLDRFNAIGSSSLERHLIKSPITGLVTPPLLREAAHISACGIGRAIFAYAKRYPDLLRHVIQIYVDAATRDREIIFTSFDQTAFGRVLIEFVAKLGIKGVEVRVIGFEVGEVRSPIEEWMEALCLPHDTQARWIRPHNMTCRASAKHIGLEVVRFVGRGRAQKDQAFHAAMVLAAVVEVWRFV